MTEKANKSFGVLLINLGTPDSPKPKDVYRYLIEFLTDGRVIDLPWLWRQLLVRGMIVPFRYRQSAQAYRAIWTKEGSPLMVYSKKVQQALQSTLGESFQVELAMRYRHPSIQTAIDKLMKIGITHLIVLPLFPQYASATTGSVYQKVIKILSRYFILPKLIMINEFAHHPSFINALFTIASQYPINQYDHFLFSFHGLPQRHLIKTDSNHHCFKKTDCCSKRGIENHHCYSAQCFATANALIQKLNLSQNQYTICFQSRLGKDPWLQPYTSQVVQKLGKEGKKRILVFCPSFICDCLETIYEIGEENSEVFLKAGGEKLDLVRGLNDDPVWIDALKTMILEHVYSNNLNSLNLNIK